MAPRRRKAAPRRRRFSIVLAAGNAVFLQGLRSILQAERSFSVVATCEDTAACIAAIRSHAPDLALFEISLPGRGGLEVLAAIAAEGLRIRPVLLTSAADGKRATRAIHMGASGLVPKEIAPQCLVRRLRQVACGQRLVPVGFDPRTSATWPDASIVALTLREQQVLELAVAGLSNRETGTRLGIGESTVKVHLHHVYEKLGVTGRTALAAVKARRPARRRA